MKRLGILACVMVLFVASTSFARADEQDLIRQMQSDNAVLMIRHALAPVRFADDDLPEVTARPARPTLPASGLEKKNHPCALVWRRHC